MRPSNVNSKFTPLIKFSGKRSIPKNIDHTPKVHPLSGMKESPKSFFSGTSSAQASSGNGEKLDSILDLPPRFQTPQLSEAELEQINSGAAEIIY